MGNTNKGRTKEIEQLQQKAEKAAQCIHAALKIQRTLIESILHTVNSQHAHVEQLLKDVPDLGRIIESITWERTEEKDLAKSCLSYSSEWKKNTETLLASVQSSLECQSESLLMSFQSLNNIIFETFHSFGIEVGSSNVDDMERDLSTLKYDNSPQTNYMIEYKKLRETSEKEINKLEKENRQLNEDIQKTRKEMEDCLKQEKEEMQKIKQQYQAENVTLKKTLEDKNSELESNKKSMEHKIVDLKTDNETLEQRLNDIEEHKPVSIQLYYQLKGDMISKILDELKSLLVRQIGVKRSDLQFIVCQRELDVNPDIPVLVFCINTSRLGTDAGNVLHDLKVSSKVAVLIFHHKDVHALPNQSSDRVLTGPDFKVLGGIFDIAFLSEKGIYPCDMNNAAAVGIENFLKTQS